MEKGLGTSINFSLKTFKESTLEKNAIEKNKAEYIYSVLLSFMYAVSVIYCLIFSFEIDINHTSLILLIAIEAFVINCLWKFRKKYITAILPIGLIMVLGETASRGLAVIGNSVLGKTGELTGVIYNPFLIEEGIKAQTLQINGAIVLAVISIWAVMMGTHIFRDVNWIAGIVTFIAVLLQGLVFLGKYNWIPLGFLLTTFILAWIRSFIDERSVGTYKLQVFIKSFKPVSYGLVIFTLIVCLAGNSVSANSINIAKSLREKISDISETVRYGDDSERIMPEGNFDNLGELVFTNKDMLKIQSNDITSCYLRGFVGGTYTGNGWEPIENNNLYERADVFYWMHENEMFGQTLIAKSAQIIDKEAKEQKVSFKITTLGADRKYFYAPYETIEIVEDEKEIMNSGILSEDSFLSTNWKGTSEYTIEALKNQVKRYPTLVLGLAEQISKKDEAATEYITAESHYNNFVHSNYTDVPERTARLIEKGLSKAGEKRKFGSGKTGYKEAKAATLSLLNKAVTYKESTETYSGEQDFIEEFLTETREGYSVHYATAATMILRYYGIPARYVEGYLITPEDAKLCQKEGEIILTDKSAHAWVEYYQDGVGWIPLEVTPAYMDVMEKPEGITASDNPYETQSGSSGSLGLEMEQDNYEKEDEKKEDEPKELPVKEILLAGSLIIALLLMSALLIHLIKRHKKVAARKKKLSSEDLNEAVKSTFAYILALHEAIGIEKENKSIFAYGEDVNRLMGTEEKCKYIEAAHIYQKAEYSTKSVTEEEFQVVTSYKTLALDKVRKQNLFKRFNLKWLKGLY